MGDEALNGDTVTGNASPRAGSTVAAAMEAVQAAEHAESLSGPVREFLCSTRTAFVPGTDGIELEWLADPIARNLDPEIAQDTLVAGCHSGIVVTGKYSRTDQIKARTYLVHRGELLSFKIWRSAEGESRLGIREQDMRAMVAQAPEYRAPEVLSTGSCAGVDYLLERAVCGRQLEGSTEHRDAARELIPTLAAAYRRHGVTERPLDSVVSPAFRERLDDVLGAADLPWSTEWGSLRRVTTQLNRLIHRNRTLPCSLGHGDLVLSNVIKDRQGHHVLVDWEYAKVMPVAFDLGKLVFASGHPAELTRESVRVTKPFDGRGMRRYRWNEQLALGLAQMISWSGPRRARAKEVGRLEPFDRELAERLRWLGALLEA